MADVPALRRAVAMLRAVSLSNEPMSAGQLSRELDIPRSTVYDILAVLEELNVVSKRKNGYVPGPASTGVGAAYLRSVPLVNAAAPAMRALADAIDGCVHLSTLRGNEAQILTADRGPDAPMCPSWPGDVQPVATSAAGQAILSCLPKGAIAELIDEDLLPKVLEELRAVRLRGYAIEHCDDSSTWTISAALQSRSGSLVAALSVVLPADYWNADNELRVAKALKLTVKRLSDRLN
ncbi:IclR family transcriptional regulator [Brevibacterium ravenspurgense]|uniref:IclR family transcriptional regulator n=1 Tax=Brevibacterium ravenspurgense TaxID=479117 RepID=UPI0007808FFC|nr:helix-turn-helix domain-containing protein [Brevibacterium ravenspurgense]